MTRRTGLLGGRFDPPHAGHLRLAQLALDALDLEELRFVPTATSPHKVEPVDGAPAAGRLRLLEALLAGTTPAFRVEPLELARGGTSYTVDTLESLSAREPDRAWILVVGSDQLAGFARWRSPERILELASLAVAPRPGHAAELPAALAERLRPRWSGAPGELVWLPSTELELASRTLRQALARGDTPDGLDIQVRAAIDREKLYRCGKQEHE